MLEVATHPAQGPSYWEATMRFYTQQHRFYAGIDLHARTLHLCVLDQAGTVVFDHNLPCRPDVLLAALAPCRTVQGRRYISWRPPGASGGGLTTFISAIVTPPEAEQRCISYSSLAGQPSFAGTAKLSRRAGRGTFLPRTPVMPAGSAAAVR